MNAIQPKFRHVLCIWWALTWRSVLVVVVFDGIQYLFDSLIIPGLRATGLPNTIACSVIVPFVLLIALALSLFPIYSILGKDFGSFRLILATKESSKDVFHLPPGVETRA